MLKASEGAASVIFGELKSQIDSSFIAKIGALILKPYLMKIKDKYDYSKVGAGIMLGINKPIFKAHGSSNRRAIKNAIFKAEEFMNSKINENLEGRLWLEKKLLNY